MSGLAYGDRASPIAAMLGGAAAAPFAVTAVAQWLTVPHLPAAAAMTAGVVYAAVVLTFLGGMHWGLAASIVPARRQPAELALSLLPPLAACIALALPAFPGISLLLAGFLLQGQWDVMTAENGRLPGWFGKLGMLLTASAVLSLLAMLFRLLI